MRMDPLIVKEGKVSFYSLPVSGVIDHNEAPIKVGTSSFVISVDKYLVQTKQVISSLY